MTDDKTKQKAIEAAADIFGEYSLCLFIYLYLEFIYNFILICD